MTGLRLQWQGGPDWPPTRPLNCAGCQATKGMSRQMGTRIRGLAGLGVTVLLLLLNLPLLVYGNDAVPRATDFGVVGHRNTDQRIRLRASLPLPDGGELGLPLHAEANALSLNGSAPPRLKALTANTTVTVLGAGMEVPVLVTFSSAVVVHGSPALLLNTGCRSEACTTPEVQSFTCRADEGAFAIELPMPPGHDVEGERDGMKGRDGVLVNVPADASRDQLKEALESLPYIHEVSVLYGDDDDRTYSRGDRACTSVGNNITLTFHGHSYPGVDGDLPMLKVDWLNAPLDPRTFQSLGDGSFLSARFPGAKVGTSHVTELVKGKKMDDTPAVYVGGSGSATLHFRYTVRSGDNTQLLDVHGFDLRRGRILSNRTLEPVSVSLLPSPLSNASVSYPSASSLSFSSSHVVSTSPARIVDVTTLNSDGVYTSGDVITVLMTFSVDVVIVSGPLGSVDPLPVLLLNSGGVGGRALARHSNGSVVTFTYTIGEGDYARELDYFDRFSLVLGNGSILTASTTPHTRAIPLLPNPGMPGSISARRHLTIDTSRPFVRNFSAATSSGDYGAGADIPLTLTFNTNVTVAGRPYFWLNMGPPQRLVQGRISTPSAAAAIFGLPPRPGQPSDIALNFTTNVALKTGDMLHLTLPDFTSSADVLGLSLGGANGSAFSGNWSLATQTVALRVADSLTIGEVGLVLSASNGIHIPDGGVRQTPLQPFQLALQGRVPTTTASAVASVAEGVGLLDASLTLLATPIAGGPASLQVSLTTAYPLLRNDTLTIALPGFDGPLATADNGTVALLLTSPSLSLSAHWVPYTGLLLLTALAPSASRTLTFTLPSTQGLSYPPTGLDPSAGDVTVSISSLLHGDCGPAPLTLSTGLGAFGHSAIAWAPAALGGPTAAAFSFELGPGDLQAGDVITLHLPAGFVGPIANGGALTLSAASGALFRGVYSSVAQTLAFTATQPLSANTRVTITVEQSSGLRLPATGLLRGVGLDVSVSSSSAFVAPTPVQDVQYVTGFSALSLAYLPPRLSPVPSTLWLRATLLSPLQVDDSLVLTLPGFRSGAPRFHRLEVLQRSTFNSTLQSLVSSHNFTATVTDSPDSDGLLLTLFAEQAVPAGTQMSLYLYSSLGLFLPSSGLSDNDPSLTVTVSSSSGHVASLPISVSPCVGFCASSLVYNDTMAGAPVAVTLGFTASTTLVSTDVLRVSLPGFTGLASSSLRHTDARPASAPARLFRLSWAPSAQRLTVTLTNGSIPTRSPVSLTFTGLWLPTTGLSANDPSLTLTTNARNLTCSQGVVACVRTYTNATPIVTSPAVLKATALLWSSLSYTDESAGAPIGLNVSLAIDAPLTAGDVLVLKLPGFTLRSGVALADLSPMGPSGALFSASFDPASANLTLTALGPVGGVLLSEGAAINVSLPFSEGLVLPETGLSADDPGLLVWGALANGYIPTQPVQHSPVVPGLRFSRLSYLPSALSTSVQVHLSVTLTSSLSSSASIKLLLPSFTGPATVASLSMEVNGTATTAGLTGSWSLATQTITFSSSSGLSAGTFAVRLLTSNALVLPSTGLLSDSPDLRLLVSDGALSLNASVTASPCIGLCDARLVIGLRKRGFSSPLLLTLTPSYPLTAGDRFALFLDGFTAPALVGSSRARRLLLGGNHSAYFFASWTQSVVSFTYSPPVNATPLAANSPIWLRIERRNLVLLPSTPLEWNDARLGINATSAVIGGLKKRPLTYSNPVGVLYASSLDYGTKIAASPTAITVTFRASSDLLTNEHLQLDLPGFGSPLSGIMELPGLTYMWGANGPFPFNKATWNPAYQYLTLGVSTNLFANSSFTCVISIPAAAGLRLPAAGLAENDPRLRLSVYARDGPIVSESVATSPGIGALLLGQLTFTSKTLDGPTALGWRMRLGGPLEAGDTVDLYLPGFNRTLGDGDLVAWTNGSRHVYFNATWTAASSTLTLLALAALPAEVYNVTLPLSAGLRLPSTGLCADDPRLLLSTTSATCPIQPPVSIPRSDGVGLLADAALRFPPTAAAGAGPTALWLDLLLNGPLGGPTDPASPLTLVLPGFVGLPRSFGDGRVVQPDGATLGRFNGSWANASTTLTLTFPTFRLPGRRRITLVVPSTAGLAAPTRGLSSSPTPPLTVALFQNGSVNGTRLTLPLRYVQPLGALLTSTLRFAPALAGQTSTLTLNLTLSASLAPSETLSVLLPGFTLSSSPSTPLPLSLTTDPPDILSGSVQTQAPSVGLLITLTARVAFRSVMVVVNATNGVRLPSTGLASDPSVVPYPRVYTDAAAGPIAAPGQVIRDTTPVAFLSGAMLTFRSTDLSSVSLVGGNRRVLRLPPTFPLSSANIGEQYDVGGQLMTVAAVVGGDVWMEEAYTGPDGEGGSVWVSSPGFRPAVYMSGNRSDTLTFVYRVREADNSSRLEAYDGTIHYPSIGDWIRRSSMHPATDVDPELPLPGTFRSLSYNRHIVIDTRTPVVRYLSSTKRTGTYALGDIIDVQVVFDKPVSVKPTPAIARLVLPLLQLDLATSDSGPRFAQYAAGSGTDSLTFTYVIGDGDVSRANGTYTPTKAAALDAAGAQALRTVFGGFRNYVRRAATQPTTDADLTLPDWQSVDSLSHRLRLYVNASAPRVLSVTTNATADDAGLFVDTPGEEAVASGGGITLGAGAAVFVFVHFSTAVEIDVSDGRPYILMATGGTKQPARFVGISDNGRSLIFRYVVREGDVSDRDGLDYACDCADFTKTTFIQLNGSAVFNASVVLPRPGGAGSLQAASPLVHIATGRPRVIRVDSLTADGTYGAGEEIDLAVRFTTPVSVYGSPRLEVSTGDTVCQAVYRAGNGTSVLLFRYSVGEHHGSALLDYTGVQALVLNGGAIRRFSASPITDADLRLPVPGHYGSLGFHSRLVIDASHPVVTNVRARVTASPYASWNVPVQTLDVFCGAGASLRSLRLRYGDALTPCLSCDNISAVILEDALLGVGGSQLVASVSEVPHVREATRFLVHLRGVGRDGARLPLRVVSCSDSEQLVASKAVRDAMAGTLHQTNRDLGAQRFQSGVVDVMVNFSAPVTVRGEPYLDMAVGGYHRRAHYAPSGSVQEIDVGVTASRPVTRGEFQLRYDGEVTGCIGWNLTASLQTNALRNRLLVVPAIAALGLKSVRGERAGNGYRFRIEFDSADPLPLEVMEATLEESNCQAFLPTDARAMVLRSNAAAFRYNVREGARLTLTLQDDVSAGERPSSLSFLLETDARLHWPIVGAPRGVEDFSLSVVSDRVPIASTLLAIDPLPAFLASSLAFPASRRPANDSDLHIGWQLNANMSVGDAIDVVLPAFVGPSTAVALLLGGNYAASFSATWAPATNGIAFVATRRLQAYEVVELTVLSDNGIELPASGLRRNDPDVQLSLSSPTTGHVSAHAFTYTEPVGVANASLAYAHPTAGEVSAITLTLELGDDLQVGDEVRLHLPGFSAPRRTDREVTLQDYASMGVPSWQINTNGFNATPLFTSGSLSPSFEADWDSRNESIRMVATQSLPAGVVGNITFLPRNKLALPRRGLEPNDPSLQLSLLSARVGYSFDPTPVPFSPAVGYFVYHELTIEPRIPGAVVNLTLAFILSAPLSPLEALRVTLPGFHGCNNRSLALGGPHASAFTGYWVGPEDTWLLVAGRSIANGTQVEVSLLPSNHVRLATSGLIDLPTVGTNASMGPVTAAPLNVTRLGHFLHSEVTYSAASTSQNISLGLRFRYNAPLGPGSGVWLRFDGLRSNITSWQNGTVLFVSGVHARDVKATIGRDDSGAVTFVVWPLRLFAINELVNVTLGCSRGLRLPLSGMQDGDKRVSLWSNSTFAPMPSPEPVAVSPPVGFHYSALRFGLPRAGAVSDVHISLSASSRLFRGDSIRVNLPGFNTSSMVDMATPVSFTPTGPAGALFAAVWDAASDTLTLKVVAADIAPRRVDLTMPASLGLSVPRNGTLPSSGIFYLDADTRSMDVLRNLPIRYIQPVGAATLSLRFHPPTPGQVAEIRLQASFNMGLHAYERVEVKLPGFSADSDIADATLDAASAALCRADWIESTSTLALTAKADVPRLQALEIVVASSNGLRVSSTGFRRDHGFTLATDASDGPMLPTVIADLPPLAWPRVSSVAFAPRFANTPIRVLEPLWLLLTLQLDFGLLVDDAIDVRVPGLLGPSAAALTVNGSLAQHFTATWHAANHTVRFQSLSALPVSSKPYKLALGPANNLRLSRAGLAANDEGVLLFSNATHGNMYRLRPRIVQAVGAASSSLRFSPAIAGATSAISLRLTLSEDLRRADKVTVTLPLGFSGDDMDTLLLTGASASLFTGAYVNTSRVLNFTCRAAVIKAQTLVELTVSADNGLRSPTWGVPSQSIFTLSIDGPTFAPNSSVPLHRPVTDFEPFGALAPSSLRFLPAVAGGPSSLVANFTTSCALQPGDAVQLHLADFAHFGDNDGTHASLALSGPPYAGHFRVSFDACQGLLTLLTVRAIPAATTLALTVSGNGTSSGILLPPRGLTANDRRLRISSNATGCPVGVGPIGDTQAVPAVVSSALAYSPSRIDEPVALFIHFNLTAPLSPSDNVTLYLPGFTGPALEDLSLNGSLAENFRGYWRPSTSKLVLGVRRAISAFTSVNLTVLADNNLELPAAGLAANDKRLKVSFSADSGRLVLKNASVQSSPGVGLLGSYLSFEGDVARAGEAVTLQLGLSLSFPVTSASDLGITVALPSLTGASQSNLFLTGGRGYPAGFTGQWDGVTRLLTLNCTGTRSFAAGEAVVVVIDRRNGLKLPVDGITQEHKQDMQVRVRAQGFGATEWAPIHRIPSVGAVLGASLSFTSRVAGGPTSLLVNVSLNGNLTSGDQIILGFGRLYRDWFQPVALRGPSASVYDAEWSPGDFGHLLLAESAEAIVENGGKILRAATTPVLSADLRIGPHLGLNTTSAAGNASLPIADSDAEAAVFIDGRAAPAVAEIFTTLAASPTVQYAGTVVDVHVRFTDPVVLVGGMPMLSLDVGRTAVAYYDRGNGSDTFVFLYHIEVGDFSPDLACFDARALSVGNGGAILLAPRPPQLPAISTRIGDIAALEDSLNPAMGLFTERYTQAQAPPLVPANLSLPLRCNRLARRSGLPQPLYVDGRALAPVVTVSTEKADGEYGAGEIVDLYVKFGVPVVVVGTPLLRMATGQGTTASFTRGGRVQSFILGSGNGAESVNGGFVVQYKGAQSDCVTWNGTYNVSTSIADRLMALPTFSTDLVGRLTATQRSLGQTVRVTLAFPSGYPEAVLLNTTFCGGSAEEVGVAPSDTLTFRYVAKQGDAADPLEYDGMDSLLLPLGSAILLATERPVANVNLTLPFPGSPGSLSNSSALIIDTAPPVVTAVWSPMEPGRYGVGIPVPIHVSFNVAVNVTGGPRLSLNVNPVQRYATYTRGSGTDTLIFTYMVQFPDLSPSLNYKGVNALELPSVAATIRRTSQRPVTDADLRLPLLNSTDSLLGWANITVDYLAPARVVEVSSLQPDGTYLAGQEVFISVRFSSPVSMNGRNASLLLDTANILPHLANSSLATYQGGSGGDTLIFRYIVREGDNATRLNFHGPGALQVPANSTIADARGGAAVLTLHPAAGDVRALNFSRAIRLRSIAPKALYVTTTKPDGVYGIGEALSFQVVFSAPVAVVGLPKLQLQTFYLRADAQAVYVNGSGTDTLTFVYVTADRDWPRGLPAATSLLVDYDGVAALAMHTTPETGAAIYAMATHPTLPAILWLPRQDQSTLSKRHVIRVDPEPPYVVKVWSTKNGSFGVGEDIPILVVFTAPVVVTGTPTILMGTGADHASCRYAPFFSGNGTDTLTFMYTVREGDRAAVLDYVDTRKAPYSIPTRASFAMTVSDTRLSARNLPPLSALSDVSVRRQATYPTTNAELALPLPGSLGSLSASNQLSLAVDSRPPTVISVTTNVPDGIYGVDYVMDLFVLWSAPVAVYGAPFLLMNAGPTPRPAYYRAGNGSANLTFRYIVQVGDQTTALDYKSTSDLKLFADASWVTDGSPPAAIYRMSDHPTTKANLTLPRPGKPRTIIDPKSLTGNGHKIRVDTTGLVVVRVDAGVEDGVYGVGAQIPIALTFTETVTVSDGHPLLYMDVGDGRWAHYVNGSGSRILNFVYSVRRGDEAERLGYKGQLACFTGTAKLTGAILGQSAVVVLPPPGKLGSLDFDRYLTVRTSSPFVTRVSAAVGPGVYGVGDRLPLHVTFSDGVTVVSGTPHLLLRLNTTSASSPSGLEETIVRVPCEPTVNQSSVLTCTYTVAAGHSTPSLEYYDTQALVLDTSVSLRAATTPYGEVDARLPCPFTARSLAHPAAALGPIRIATAAPTVTDVAAVTRPGTFGLWREISVSIRFSVPVRVSGVPVLLLNSGPLAKARYVRGSGSDLLFFRYTVGEGEAIAALDYRDTDSLVLEGVASIVRLSGSQQQMASLILPVRGQVGSLGRSAILAINAYVPRVRAVFTSLRNGTYGPGTHVPLYVWFTSNVSVLHGRSPVLSMRSSPVNASGLVNASQLMKADYLGQRDPTTLLFGFDIPRGAYEGRLELAGPFALACPVGTQRPCVATPRRQEEADLTLAGLSLQYMDPKHRENTTRPSSVTPDNSLPFVSQVAIVSPLDPLHGYGPGDIVRFSAEFTSPIVDPHTKTNRSSPDWPRLILNVARNGSVGEVSAPHDGVMVGWTLFFTYHVQMGDCVAVLDYLNDTALVGHVYRERFGNSTLAEVTLAVPGRRGSISYNQKATIPCSKPQVAGIIPLPRAARYIEGDPIFLAVRFTQPVTVTSGTPLLLLDVTGGGPDVGAASYYPHWPISASLSFDKRPTDLIFLYTVEAHALTPRLTHASASALQLNGGQIMRATATHGGSPLQPADLTLAPPQLTDETLGSIQGRWWGDYAARVEVLLHGLWHQDVGDLRLRLVHGNNSATLAAAGPDGYVMGSPRPRPFQPPPAKPWAMGRLRRTLQPFNLTQAEEEEAAREAGGDGKPPLTLQQQQLMEQMATLGIAEDQGKPAPPETEGERGEEGLGMDYVFADLNAKNLAPFAVASQSSTMRGGVAERATDGNVDGRWAFNSVSHTGEGGSAEVEPWWQLRFMNDHQPLRTVRLWSRVHEENPYSVQVVVVCGSKAPVGHFRVSLSLKNRTYATPPISAQAVASVREEVAGSRIPGRGTGESMQAKLTNLGVLGQVSVSRALSQTGLGFAWSVTFVSLRGPAPDLRVENIDITTLKPLLFAYTSRPGASGDVYEGQQGGSSSPCPLVLMVFNTTHVPDDCPDLDTAMKRSVYAVRVSHCGAVTTVTLPQGTRGKYLRLQREGLNFLALAEVQVFADPLRSLSEHEGGVEVSPRPITDPFQATEPMHDLLGGLRVEGHWSLQVMDTRRTRLYSGGGGTTTQRHGSGAISDWVLLVTDFAGNVRAHRMDVNARITALPKYGDLFVERPKAQVGGWEDLFFGIKDERPIPVGHTSRVLAPCYGTDTTGLNGARSGAHRHCYQNFGVGYSMAPADTSDMAAWTFLDQERAVYYRPKLNYLGPDTFSYEIMVGVRPSERQGTVSVNVRNCRSRSSRYQDADPLCGCLPTGRLPFGDSIRCATGLNVTCNGTAGARSSIFRSLCKACPLTASTAHPAACRTEVDRAVTLLKHRGMCAPPDSPERLPDCQTETFGVPAREAYLAGKHNPPIEEMAPLSNANDGAGFMWTAHLA